MEQTHEKQTSKPYSPECVIGLFKTEVINQIDPWKSMREIEWETLKWVDWYNNRKQRRRSMQTSTHSRSLNHVGH
ncbi:MAG: IS3 family transposase [Rhodobacterales bacterium]|nr:IS3 family transposase [Rhodobacterales bacterium]